MVNIVAVKLLGVAWITLMSAVGIWAPFLCLGRTGAGLGLPTARGMGGRAINVRPSHVPSGRVFLSLANCFSAGMLLTMALVHFFPTALSVADEKLTPPLLCCWMLAGVLVPALLEHGAGGGSGGGHSHGVVSGTHRDALEEGKEKATPSVSTATLLIVLMCFHGAMEGLLLGLEQHVSSLVSAATPLSIHRFFDGLVIGVSLAKEVLRSLRSDLSDPESLPVSEEPPVAVGDASPCLGGPNGRGGGAAQRVCGEASARRQSFSICGRRVWQPSVLLWLAVTPATMVVVLLLTSLSSSSSAPRTTEADAASSPLTSAKADGPAAKAWWMAVAQALGSGSFVYVGLSIFLQEELKGWRTNASILLGVVFTVLLFSLAADEH